jgi:outer membrane protein TolC
MNKPLAVLLALALSTMTPAATAGAPAGLLSLPQLLDEARRANPDLLAARKRWEAMQARIPQSKGLPPPRIGIEFEEIPRGVKLNQATIMYSLIQSLPFPGKLSAKRRVAVAEAAQAGMVFKQAEWDVTTQLKSTYYDLFLLDRELEIQREQLGWIKQSAAIAQTRYAAGLAPQGELLQAQAEQLTMSNELDVLGHRRQAMAAHLNHLLNRPVHEAVGNPPPIPLAWVSFSPEELVAIALDRQPEVLAFQYSAERADAALRLAKRELLPDLETMIELRDPAAGPFGPWDLTLALVLPFWFWTKLKYGVRVAMFDKESAQAAYQAMRNEITRRIHEHWHEGLAAYQTAQLCQDGLLGLRRQAVASTLAAYQSGGGSLMELLGSLRALREQERIYYQHLVQLEQRIILLEQASGIALRAAHEEGAS